MIRWCTNSKIIFKVNVCTFRGNSFMIFFFFTSILNGPVLKIRRGKRDNLGTIFHITPLKHML